MKTIAAIALITVTPLFFGAGCSRKSAEPDLRSLKTPAPAEAPQKAPEIPAEAKNIPRPY